MKFLHIFLFFSEEVGAEASKTETLPTSNNQRAVWLWKSNKNLWSSTEKEEKKYYSNFENEYIESANRRNEIEIITLLISSENCKSTNLTKQNKDQRNEKRSMLKIT